MNKLFCYAITLCALTSFMPLCALVSPMYDYFMNAISYYEEKRSFLLSDSGESDEYWIYTGQQMAYIFLLDRLMSKAHPFDKYELRNPHEKSFVFDKSEKSYAFDKYELKNLSE